MKGRDGYAPGSGELDSDRHPCLLRGLGHLGASGLEYVPAVDTMSSLRAIESIEGIFSPARDRRHSYRQQK